MSELLKNAEKAVLKKLYLKSKKIDPAKVTEDHIKDFHRIYKDSILELRELAVKLKQIVVFKARITKEGLEIMLENGGQPDARETEFLKRNIEFGKEFTRISELKDKNFETGEGDGLGLILAMMSMSFGGLDPRSLSVTSKSGKTSFRIMIEPNRDIAAKLGKIEKEILDEVEALPSIPQNIQKTMELCKSEKSSAKQIADEIEKDPTIASAIIKLANSGGFAGGSVKELLEAVKIVGLRNISGLLLQIGTFKILQDRYGVSGELVDHPVRVAYYSRQLARQFRMAGLADQAYVAGLLHNIGKIVLLHTMEDRDTFESIAEKRDSRSRINLEELQCGVSHSIIGSLLARKWNFPDLLCSTIEFHQKPSEATKEVKDLVFLVYLANAMAEFGQGRMHFFAVEPDVLAKFNITSDQAFSMLANNLQGTYEAATM